MLMEVPIESKEEPISCVSTRVKLTCLAKSKIKLHPYQELVVRYMMNHRGVIVAHEVGAGKTLTAVAASQCLMEAYPNMITVVVTPVSLQGNFKKTMVDYGLQADDNRYKFLTIDKFHRTYEESDAKCLSNVFLIIDEAHNLRTLHKKTTIPDRPRSSTAIKCAKVAKKIMLLTATPWYNSVVDVINLVTMVRGDDDPLLSAKSAKTFIDRLMHDKDRFKEYFSCIFSFRYRDINDPNYPKLEEHNISLVMNAEQLKQYQDVEKLYVKVNDIEDPYMFYIGLRQEVNRIEPNAKIEWILTKMRDLAKDGKFPQTVIFSTFLENGIDLIIKASEELGISQAVITGDIHKRDRTKIVEAFNAGLIQLLTITRAGAEGLDLKGGRVVIITESQWNTSSEDQTIGRIVRFGSHLHLPSDERKVDAFHLMLEKPLLDKRNPDGTRVMYMPYMDDTVSLERNKELFTKYVIDKKLGYKRAMIQVMLDDPRLEESTGTTLLNIIGNMLATKTKAKSEISSVSVLKYRSQATNHIGQRNAELLTIEANEAYTTFVEQSVHEDIYLYTKGEEWKIFLSADTILHEISVEKSEAINTIKALVEPLSIENADCNVFKKWSADEDVEIPCIPGTEIKEIYDVETEIDVIKGSIKFEQSKDLYIAKLDSKSFLVKGDAFVKHYKELRKLGGRYVNNEEVPGTFHRDRMAFKNSDRIAVEEYIFSTFDDTKKKEILVSMWTRDRTMFIIDLCVSYANYKKLDVVDEKIVKRVVTELLPFRDVSVKTSNEYDPKMFEGKLGLYVNMDAMKYISRHINDYVEKIKNSSYTEYVKELKRSKTCSTSREIYSERIGDLTPLESTIIVAIKHVALFFDTNVNVSIKDAIMAILPRSYRNTFSELFEITKDSIKTKDDADLYIKKNASNYGTDAIEPYFKDTSWTTIVTISIGMQYIVTLCNRNNNALLRVLALSNRQDPVIVKKVVTVPKYGTVIERIGDALEMFENAIMVIRPVKEESEDTKVLSRRIPELDVVEPIIGRTDIIESKGRYIIMLYAQQYSGDPSNKDDDTTSNRITWLKLSLAELSERLKTEYDGTITDISVPFMFGGIQDEEFREELNTFAKEHENVKITVFTFKF